MLLVKGPDTYASGSSPCDEHEEDEDKVMDKTHHEHEGPDQFIGSIHDRRRVYGSNYVASRKSKSLLLLMWLAFKDKILVELFSVPACFHSLIILIG